MQFEEKTTRSLLKKHEAALSEHHVWKELMVGLMSTALGVITSLFAAFIGSTKSPPADAISTGQRLSLFMGTLLVLTVIIVGVAHFIRRKDRSVILLKERLSEIYVTALRNSALNPQLESAARHD